MNWIAYILKQNHFKTKSNIISAEPMYQNVRIELCMKAEMHTPTMYVCIYTVYIWHKKLRVYMRVSCGGPTHLGMFPPLGSWWWYCRTTVVAITDIPTMIMMLAKYCPDSGNREGAGALALALAYDIRYRYRQRPWLPTNEWRGQQRYNSNYTAFICGCFS